MSESSRLNLVPEPPPQPPVSCCQPNQEGADTHTHASSKMSYFSQPANPTNVDQMEDIADNAAYLVDESGDLGNPWTKSKTAVNFTIEEDEGYEADDCPENAPHYGLLRPDGLPALGATRTCGKPSMPGDSGFSSRVSEDSASLRSTVFKPEDLTKAIDSFDQHGNHETCCTLRGAAVGILKVTGVFCLLYLFICVLDVLSSAFRLLGGKTAGSVFHDSDLMKNPIAGLMLGVLATVILQSSSTSSSIVIAMVSSGIMEVRPSIPIIMGANIGTTVTNTLVSLAHAMNPREFRRAFSGATVHDVFNWLTVLILLPLEYCAGYLFHLTSVLVENLNLENLHTKDQDLLKQLTKPLTQRIVMVNEKVITAIAEGKMDSENARLLKVICKNTTTVMYNASQTENGTMFNETSSSVERCNNLFALLDWSDTVSGIVLALSSILLLSVCLYLMVKLLHSMLGGLVARMAKRVINADFPYPFSCLTGYVALLVGAGLTVLVQSSSVFTSALTPLVGIGCLKLERMYPLTLGSNIGTTATGILAALASSTSTMRFALQIALCHLFFNITGILLFYPIPFMRRIPLRTARFLGYTTARYRWFAAFYLIMMFLVLPGCFLALSFANNVAFIAVLVLVGLVSLVVLVLNLLQKSRFGSKLPRRLQTWDWLPLCLRSLEPLDRFFRCLFSPLKRLCCLKKCDCLSHKATKEEIDSDDEDASVGTNADGDNNDERAGGCCCSRKTTQAQKVRPSGRSLERTFARHSPIYIPVGKSDSIATPFHSRTALILPESLV